MNEAVRLGFTTQIDAACGSIHAAVALALGTSSTPRDAELDRAWG
jgi:DNA repair protein RadA/Sms